MKRLQKIVLATNNTYKVREIKEIFQDSKITFCLLSDFTGMPDIVEDQDTFEGNALVKARQVFEFTNIASLADDSGLEVDYLNGEPGIRSSRFSGGDAKANNRLLLDKLKNVPEEKRTARFRCVMALCRPQAAPLITGGKLEGTIIFEERGRTGFGYDPLFIPQGYDRTFAEMAPEEKNRISHRARALFSLKKELEKPGGYDI
jgi:XTP/dITP diphosphohydrolase